MMGKHAHWGLVLMLLGINLSAFADNTLKHDPFTRTLITTIKPESSAGAASAVNVDDETPWTPTLTAVMVAGKNSLVTLDGTIMKLGEVRDGYRLVLVKDHEATFVKGKKRVVLSMKITTQRSEVKQNKEQVTE